MRAVGSREEPIGIIQFACNPNRALARKRLPRPLIEVNVHAIVLRHYLPNVFRHILLSVISILPQDGHGKVHNIAKGRIDKRLPALQRILQKANGIHG